MRRFAILLLFSASCLAQSFTKADYAVGSSPKGIASADFNRDGVADLAVANSGNASVSLLLGRADGTFATAITIAVAANPTEIATADLNNDGVPDIALSCEGGVTILYMHADGSYTRFDYLVNGRVTSVTVGDFGGDGKPDIAAVVGGKVLVLLNHYDEPFTVAATLAPEVPAIVVQASDLNRDGVMDLAIASCCQGTDVTYGAAFTAIGAGNGTFTLTKAVDQSGGYLLTVADVTRDGLPDLVMPYIGCHTPCRGVEVVTNQDGNTFKRFGGVGLNELMYSEPGQAAVADFNGDGIPDIATPFGPGDYETINGRNYDKLLVFDGKGDGTFGTQGDYPIAAGASPWGVVAADFNHDGKADVAVTNSRSGTVTVFLNNTGSAADQRTFYLQISGSPQTVKAGGKTQYEYFLDPTNGALPEIQLSCSGLPQGATCMFDPVTGGNAAIGFVTIQAAATTGSLQSSLMLAAFAMLTPIGFVAVSGVRRRRMIWAALIAVCFVIMLQVACAGGKAISQAPRNGSVSSTLPIDGSGNGTSAGNGSGSGSGGAANAGPETYQVTITATGGGTTESQTVTLIVQ